MRKHIERIAKQHDKVTFITDGSLGVAIWAFEEVHNFRVREQDRKKDINNVMILPCVKHYARWTPEQQKHILHRIDYLATHVYYTDANYYTGGTQFYKCKEEIVAKVDGVIAVWDESEGMTEFVIGCAQGKGVPILGYNPKRQKQFSIK